MTMTPKTSGYLYATACSASYGLSPIAVSLYNCGMTMDVVLWYRYVLAVVMLLALMLYRGISLRLTVRELAILVPISFAFGMSSVTLYESYKYIGISLSSTILFVYPSMVALLLWAFFGERPSRLTLCALPLIFLGVMLLDWDGIMEGNVTSVAGVVIVLLSALFYALYMVVVQKSRLSAMDPLRLSFYSLLIGSLVFVFRIDWEREFVVIDSVGGWIIVLVLAFFPTLVSLTTMAKAVKLVGSTPTALLGAFEPVTAVLIGIIFYGERPDALAYVGMVVILLTVSVIVAGGRLKKIVGCGFRRG